MTRIKLCGLIRLNDIVAVNEFEPDYIGFVFAPKSKRYISKTEALRLRNMLKDTIVPVGVFKDNPMSEVVAAVIDGAVDVAQLHGNEDDSFIRELKKEADCKVIKAFGIGSKEDIDRANCSAADMVLLDTPGGGSGRIFDHSLLSFMERPYFLAGGLDSDNVGEFIEKYRPYGVDVSSNIETDGVKDKNKMEAFVKAVRERG